MIYALNNINNNPFITLSQAYNSSLHIYVYIHRNTCIYVHICIHLYVRTYVCIYVGTYVRMYVHVYMHAWRQECSEPYVIMMRILFLQIHLPCIKYTTRNLAWHCYDIALCYRLSKRVLILLSTLSVSRRKYHRLTHCWIKRCHILIALRQYTYIVQISM